MVQVFVAAPPDAFAKPVDHARIHKSYPIIRAGNDDPFIHSFEQLKKAIFLSPELGLEAALPFSLGLHLRRKATDNAGDQAEQDGPYYRVGIGRDKERAGHHGSK